MAHSGGQAVQFPPVPLRKLGSAEARRWISLKKTDGISGSNILAEKL
jgi:hypothetical protein